MPAHENSAPNKLYYGDNLSLDLQSTDDDSEE
jgi:hypothetical protein